LRTPAFSCFSLGFAVLVAASRAAEPTATRPQFTLDAAVRKALAQSPALRVQEAEIDRREGVREQASGEFDWFTSAAVSRVRERTPTVDPLGRDAVTAGDTTGYSVNVTRKLRNGIVVQPSVEVAVGEPDAPPGPSLGASNLNLQIVVPLLRGLGNDTTGAAEAAARGDVEVARLLYRHALARQAFDTARAYWSARAAQGALAVRKDEEQRAQKLHDGIRVLVDTRVFPPNLLLQSEANLRQKSTSRQDAELAALNAGFELARIMGLQPAELIGAPAPDQPLPENITLTGGVQVDRARGQWIERAFRQRPDYLATKQSEVPLRLLARQAELDLKPRVDLNVRGGYAGLNRGNELFAPLSQRLTGANGEVAVVLEWPVQNTYQRGLLRERRAAQRQAEFTTTQAQSDIAADVSSALAEVRLRADTVRNAAATADIARKAVEQEQRRLQTGEATVLDVINLENLLSSARLSQIDAQAGYAIAVARLRFSVGEIFTGENADRSFQLSDLTQPPADEK
jgi:outer membrane protein TolC